MKQFIYGIIVYLIIIFIYANIYHNFFKGDFHHDRIQHEISIKKYGDVINDKIGDILQIHFNEIEKYIDIKPGCRMNTKTFKYLGANYNFNNKVYDVGIQYLCEIYSKDKIETSTNKKLFFQLKYMLPTKFNNNDDLLVYSLNGNDHSELRCIFNQDIISMSLKIPDDSLNLFYAYEKAINGFPEMLEDNFNRMLYFSFVTITSLGYGDVIPLSNSARIVVYTEVIIGLIFIGLLISYFFAILSRKNSM